MPANENAATTESPKPNTPTGPVAFIKSHTTVLFRQKTRACAVTAQSPRGHPMVCDRPTSRTGIGHLLHAMVEQKEGAVRVIFWRVEGQKARVPREGMSVADAAKPIGAKVRAKRTPKAKPAAPAPASD